MNARKKSGSSNDVWITPPSVIETQLRMIGGAAQDTDRWFDPFKNSGSYFNRFPTENKDYTEIIEGRDFFEYDEEIDIICSNPPYSLWRKIYPKVIALNPRVISFVMSKANLTRPRMKMMKDAGYLLTKIHQFDIKRPSKVQKELGYKPWLDSFIVQWEKTYEVKPAVFTCDYEPHEFQVRDEVYERLNSHDELIAAVNLINNWIAEHY
jgi:hypothetical protein